MDKRIKKQVAIALTGILTSGALLNSKPAYAENNEEVVPREEVLQEALENDIEKGNIRKGKVTASALNVRKGPSSNDIKIGSLKRNEIVEIESTSNGWHKIKYGNGFAYVTEQYISIIDDSNNGGPNNGGSTQEPVIKTGKVNTSTLNVRNSASSNGAKLGTVSKGTIVEIVREESNGWYRIKYKNGYGYVSAQYITVENSGGGGTTTPEQVIKKGTVNTSTLNVRSSASANGAKLGTVSKGTTVEIVKEESNGWYRIKYKNGYGYVSAQYITVENSGGESGGGGTTTPEQVIKKGTVNTSTLNVRSSASANGAKLGTVSKGATVEIVKEESNGWYRIKYKNGYGYVSGQYITVENTGGGGTTTPEPVIKKGTVNTSTLNVRSSASANGAKLGTVSRGTTVEIVKIESNGWYKIKYKNGYGYVSGQYITDQNTGGGSGGGSSDRVFQNPAGYIQIKDKISVGGAGKNLVKGTMGLRVAKVQRKLGMGQVWETVGPQTMSKVKSFQQKNGLKATGIVDLATWKKLGFSESEWYSMDAYVTPVRTNRNSTRQQIIEQMIRTAESYLGTEYVVGAAGVPGSGIDCSGLVMQAMYSVGIDPAPVSVTRHTLPGYEYESRNLWNLPTLKTVSTPQRGDLVFYKNSLGTIIHVAIYLGNNQVIESWPEKVVKWPLIHPERPLIKGYKRVIG